MLDVAIDAAKQAGELALGYFKNQPKVSYKPDKSPVTRADIEAEELIRKIITKNFPDHGIIGEELPPFNPKAKYQWVIDPIDGTKMFIRGLFTWSTLIAVMENSKPIIGIMSFPSINELYTAEKKKGAYLNNKKIRVSKITSLKDSYLTHSSIKYFDKIGMSGNLLSVGKECFAIRGYGDGYGHALLAKGQFDIFLDAAPMIHDIAAPSIIIKEAGGKFTDFNGKDSLTSGNSVATNGLLHNQVIKLLNQ